MRKVITIISLAIVGVLALGACEAAAPSGQQSEDKSRQRNYNSLIKTQPAHTMTYSPTRETKNMWIDRWKTPGKIAYIYLRSGGGDVFGYYVTKGLPVSYCTSLVPPYKLVRVDGGEYGMQIAVPGPSVDGTYSSTANCNEVYAFDAVTNAYLEWNVGMGINQQISDQPLPQYGDAEPLGPGTIKQAKRRG